MELSDAATERESSSDPDWNLASERLAEWANGFEHESEEAERIKKTAAALRETVKLATGMPWTAPRPACDQKRVKPC